MKDEDGDTKSVSEMLVEKLPIFVQSADLEVQERVSDSCQIYPSTHATKSDCNFVFVCKCPPMQVSRETIKIHHNRQQHANVMNWPQENGCKKTNEPLWCSYDAPAYH